MTGRLCDAYRRMWIQKTFEETTMNPIRLAKNWLSYRRTLSELSNLPSHTLSDIGLTRYDIRMVAARQAR
jgi:uncharacterized protein YjiS (DUF1127 family)